MSIIGTRPPLISETNLYELHHNLKEKLALERKGKAEYTLDTRMVITALKKAFMVAKPIILNSDQGCQFEIV